MIPSPWVAVVLALAGYRACRFLGWDDWPPIAKARAWVTGERWVGTYDVYGSNASDPLGPGGLLAVRRGTGTPDPSSWHPTGETEEHEIELPGKTPSSEVSDVRPAYSRPTLAHLVHCPFCLGWWVSLALYVAWLAFPTETLYVAAPFALSGAVGLIAKNLDP